ncbi:hypothetical protein SNE35_20485 [Paucibacter sp. R3-3]|uniref:Uncharacterized protein n=1 Tax=Roseateles agri TaxID=3098619 RepID=A0ABU5DKS6_9BURK|nr:hypothetical protein [Paucibacter sp. R3-3]MDY0746902.1 hypothetical protein [Paucibacter sp. R3-3]
MSIFDLDNYTDAVSDAVDAIGDAGDLIGGILKSISPLLGMVPGIGTAFSVAVYAAGAIAAKDSITDALIGSASAAMPPGVPRIAFDGAVSVSRDVVEGRPVTDSVISACRHAAQSAGGAPAAAAFDSGVAVLKGGPVDQRIIDQGRAFALQGGGQAAAASYDAGVSIARGRGADQVVVDVARGYISQVGGPVALAAFDTGVALAYAKTLREAAYAGLHTLVRGNDGIEKILNFIEKVGRAKTLASGVQQLLESDLAEDFLQAIHQYVPTPNIAAIERELQPYTDFFRDHPELLNVASGDLAGQWEIDEAIVRAAQALMRDGTRDERLLKLFEQVQGTSIGKGDLGGDLAGTKDRNDAYARQGREMASGDKQLTAHRSNNGRYVPGLWVRGFDVGSAVSHRQSEFGPGQTAIRDSLRGASQQSGYNRARDLQYQRTIKLHQALDGLSKQVLSGREEALSAFGMGLGALSTTAARATRAAAMVPLTPKSPAHVDASGETDAAAYPSTPGTDAADYK